MSELRKRNNAGQTVSQPGSNMYNTRMTNEDAPGIFV